MSLILASPSNARRDWDSVDASVALDGLASSIHTQGLLQPIVVRPIIHDNKDAYQIIAGERRFRACQSLGWEEIPCVVRDATQEEALISGLAENIQRRDLNAIERAEGLAAVLQRIDGLTEEALAGRIGKTQGWVSNQLRLLTLPAEVRGLIREGKITGSHGAALVPVAKVNPRKAVEIAQEAAKFRWSSATVEEEAAEFLAEHRDKEKKAQPALPGTTTTTTEKVTKTEPSKPPAEVKPGYTAADAKREFEESQQDDPDVKRLADLPTPPAVATGAAQAELPTPTPAEPLKAATAPKAATGKTVGVHIDQRWDDWLWENDLETVDQALEQLAQLRQRASELAQRPQLTPLAHKCLKALTAEEQELSERLEDILVGRARTEGINIDILNEIPE